MSGITLLVLLAVLTAIMLRWTAGRLRLPAPTFTAIIIVFVLVVLALWGQSVE